MLPVFAAKRRLMDVSQRKEQFSKAYVRAIASAAGYDVSGPSVDDDGVDLVFSSRSKHGVIKSPKIEAQIKCTSQDILKSDNLIYPLEVKNYNLLIQEDFLVPRILIVVLVPEEAEQWLSHDESYLMMRHCGYWISLKGSLETLNTEKISISIPRKNCFNLESLHKIMDNISEGIDP